MLRDHGAASVRLTSTGLEGAPQIKANAALATRAAETLAAAKQSPPKTDLVRFTADLAKDVDPSVMTPADVEQLRTLIDASGARAQVEDVIAHLTERALQALDAADVDDTARAVLAELAAAATQRTV